jgi:glycosyltransferase involved in cell wall biosynthesis
MRILFVGRPRVQMLGRPDDERCLLLAEAFAERGHTAGLLSVGEELEEVPRGVRFMGVLEKESTELRHRERRAIGARNTVLMRNALDDLRPEAAIVFCGAGLSLAVGRVAERRCGTVVFILSDDALAQRKPASSGLNPFQAFRFLADRTIRRNVFHGALRLEHTVCDSHALRRDLKDKKLDIDEATVMYPGIPLGRFPLKDSPGLIQEPVRLLYVGPLDPSNGVHILLAAAGLIAEARGNDKVTVTIAGEGDPTYRKKLERQAKTGPAVAFEPTLGKDRASVYRDHDVLAFPSTRAEPFNQILIEAMASGTLVISTPFGSRLEVLEDMRNGLIIDRGSARQLANRISRLVNDPELARRIALGARATVEERFALDGYAARLEALVKETVGQSR